jgi:ribosomal protein L37AE/L43A
MLVGKCPECKNNSLWLVQTTAGDYWWCRKCNYKESNATHSFRKQLGIDKGVTDVCANQS